MDRRTQGFQRTEAIFNEALAAAPEARAALIEMRTEGDRELEDEVRSLLEANEAEERLTAARLRMPEAGGREAAGEERRVGPYVLDRLLGRAAWARSIWRNAPTVTSSKR